MQENKGVNTNRNNKAGMFAELFSDKKNLLELYNAIKGTNYSEDTKVEIVTLTDVLFMEELNDIAFVIENKLVVLIEHQSSINRNMPLRMLLYIGREYERITEAKNLYREEMVEIPTPEFIVLYNGKKEMPDYEEMRLSDSFKLRSNVFCLDLLVKVYNINNGRNAGIVSRSPTLGEYSEFVAEVERNKKTMSRSDAIITAVRSCMGKGILVYFLRKHGSEVLNMLYTKWNWDDAKEVWQEEAEARGLKVGIEKGIEQGIEQGIEKGIEQGIEKVFALLDEGVSLVEAKKILGF